MTAFITKTSEEEALAADMLEGIDFLLANYTRLDTAEKGFAKGLCDYFQKHGKLTDKQFPYAAKFIGRLRILVNPDAPRTATIDWNTSPLWNLFTAAYQSGLVWPKIRFHSSMSGRNFEVYRSASGEKNLIIRMEDQRIAELPKGRPIIWKSEMIVSNATKVELKRFFDCEDLVSRLAVNGKERVNCCFCGLQLSNKESLTVGYGPICAENWNLPWGPAPLPGKEFEL